MAARKHWSDLPLHASHAWRADSRCDGCLMRMTWPGARYPCSNRTAREPRKARALEAVPYPVAKPKAAE